MNGQKFIKNAENGQFGEFMKKIEKLKCEIFLFSNTVAIGDYKKKTFGPFSGSGPEEENTSIKDKEFFNLEFQEENLQL